MQPFKYNPNFNSGSFRHRITVQNFVSEKDELGQESDGEWVDFKQVWSNIKTMQGREYFAAAATQNENNVRFIIRYTPDVEPSMRIQYKGHIYEIVSVINDDEANKTLTIITKEGGQNGS
jgi:SPP1 family predicted phage head-tail adaptor